ncbi:MAG TPA: YhjD/YihY/BrkB family envelope integrity protein [Thermoanaerobaculia bacterium]|nr:YhjD/YihY/BrkB family envelope integrity protein [Thermoanaerobaculia bacterium]
MVDPERPAAPARRPGPSFPRRIATFFGLSFRQSNDDSILLTASALAFVTVLSLIPLLAALSYVGARVFSQYQQKSFEVFVKILPYAEKPITDKLAEFLAQARALHGFGVAAFFITAMMVFSTIERTINKIWNVARHRPIRVRIATYLLLMFWGPALLAATFSSLILLRQSPAFRQLVQRSVLLGVLPFAAALVGLVMLYWFVPYTPVRFRNALAGALVAAILLELLRFGFGLYVEFFRNVSAVYGSFAFALLFMISIELTWAIILYGAEVAYTAQHFPVLSLGLYRQPPMQAAWVGLAAVAVISGRFVSGAKSLSEDDLAARLRISPLELNRVLHPLLTHDLLRRTEAGEPGYLLAADPHEITLDQIFQAYDHRARRAVQPLPQDLRHRLEALVAGTAMTRGQALSKATMADLLQSDEETLQLILPTALAGTDA